MRNSLSVFVSVGFSSLLISCITAMYGINDISPESESGIRSHAVRFHIPIEDTYELDTSYWSFIRSIDTTQFKAELKNHYQPLQSLYYDSTGRLISFHVNCYTGGFPNLDWTGRGHFEKFPATTMAPADSLLPLQKHISFLKKTQWSAPLNIDTFDYVVLVHWNGFMGRQSNRFMQVIRKNVALAKNVSVKTIYVNTDNFWWMMEKKVNP